MIGIIAGIIGLLCLSCVLGVYPVSTAASPTPAVAAPTVEKSGSNIVLKGSGIADTPDFNLRKGLATAHIELLGSRTLYSVVLTSHDKSVNIPFDTFNLYAYTGQPGIKDTTQTVNVPADGSYYIKVNYGDGWQITITQ